MNAVEFELLTARRKDVNFSTSQDVRANEAVVKDSYGSHTLNSSLTGEALPEGKEIFNVTRWGASAWVHTACIEARDSEGEKKLYFLKVCVLARTSI